MRQSDQFKKLSKWLTEHKSTHPRFARKTRTFRRLLARMTK